MARSETDDPAVFQIAPDDRLDPDVFGQARYAGTQAADAANDQFDAHAPLAGAIQGVDDLGIDQGVHLGPDGRGLAHGGGRHHVRARFNMRSCLEGGAFVEKWVRQNL